MLEQNADEIRKAVGNESYILEHHCNIVNEDAVQEVIYKNLTDNWDCPLIATTAVQLLNTLFSGDKVVFEECTVCVTALLCLMKFRQFPQSVRSCSILQ